MGKYFALIYTCLILYLGSGCSGFQPEPLDFFEVRTDSIAASSTLGSLIVFGKINAQDLSIISDHGVIWSTDRSKLEKGELDMVSKKSLGKIGTEVFTVPINLLNLDSIYYFRTFSQAEAGRIHLGNILSFSFSILSQSRGTKVPGFKTSIGCGSKVITKILMLSSGSLTSCSRFQ